jgi:hypothetical protein
MSTSSTALRTTLEAVATTASTEASTVVVTTAAATAATAATVTAAATTSELNTNAGHAQHQTTSVHRKASLPGWQHVPSAEEVTAVHGANRVISVTRVFEVLEEVGGRNGEDDDGEALVGTVRIDEQAKKAMKMRRGREARRGVA